MWLSSDGLTAAFVGVDSESPQAQPVLRLFLEVLQEKSIADAAESSFFFWMVKSLLATLQNIQFGSVRADLENHYYYGLCGAARNSSDTEWIFLLLFAAAGGKHTRTARSH